MEWKNWVVFHEFFVDRSVVRNGAFVCDSFLAHSGSLWSG